MAASSSTLHEDPAQLGSEAIDRHRAIVSIMEELEAVDWYDQRCLAAADEELRTILAHNRDEEKEHAAMLLEWLRRHDDILGAQLRTYLFSNAPIVGLEKAAEGEAGGGEGPGAEPSRSDGSLGIGSLRGEA